MQKIIAVISVLSLLMVSAACTFSELSDYDPLDGTSWELFAYRKSKPLANTVVTLTFKDGEIHGSSGCNTYGGLYTIEYKLISIQEIYNTEMACLEPKGVMEQETLVLDFLREAQKFRINDEQLMIFRTDSHEALTFIPIPNP